jgi:hypothetical protein
VLRRRAAQGVHRQFQAAVQVPGVGGVQLLLNFALALQELVHVGVGIAEGLVDGIVFGQQVHGLLGPFGYDVLHGFAGLQLGFLFEIADGEPGADGDFPVVFGIDPGHDFQQGGLARAVETDDADFRAVEIREADVLDYLPGSVVPTHLVHGVNDFFIFAVAHALRVYGLPGFCQSSP